MVNVREAMYCSLIYAVRGKVAFGTARARGVTQSWILGGSVSEKIDGQTRRIFASPKI